MNTPDSKPGPEPAPDEDEARVEYERRAAALEEELRSGAISHGEYERRKSEAWEVYRTRSGALLPDDERR